MRFEPGDLDEHAPNLRLLTEAIPHMLWSATADGMVDYVNQRVLDYARLPYEECLGVGWGIAIHPDHAGAMAQAWRVSVASGEPFQFEFLGQHAPDETWRWCVSSALPGRDADGRVERWYGSIVDLHDRKQAEEARLQAERQYRTVIETATDAIVTIDETSTIVLVNPAVTKIFGYAPEELIGQPLTVLMPGRLASGHLSGMRRYLETGHRGVNWAGIELTGVRKSGEEFPVEISFAEVANEPARTFTGFIRDITERKQAEAMKIDFARVSRLTALGEFAASIAHEVRQPVSAILMNAKTCLRLIAGATPDLNEVRAALVDVVEAGRRADELIRRNRELFKDHTLRKSPLDINDVVREATVLAKGRLRTGHVTLTTTLADLPQVHGDRVELQQVLLNLIANGIDALEGVDPAGRHIHIATALAPDGLVKVAVSDTGVGLEGVDRERIFTLFHTTKPTGSGVGLSISRSIVEAHGGRLWAEPNGDRGATFCFTVTVHPTVVAA